MNTFTYRKVSEEVEAFQLQEDDGTRTLAYPQWLLIAIRSGRLVPENGSLNIYTDEGVQFAGPGDWIVKDSQDRIFCCDDSVFLRSYYKA